MTSLLALGTGLAILFGGSWLASEAWWRRRYVLSVFVCAVTIVACLAVGNWWVHTPEQP